MVSFKLPFFFSPIAYNYYHYCLNNTLNGNLNNLLLDNLQIRFGQVTIDAKVNAVSSKNVYQEILNKWGWARMYFFLPEVNSSLPVNVTLSTMDGIIYVHNTYVHDLNALAVNYIAIGK